MTTKPTSFFFLCLMLVSLSATLTSSPKSTVEIGSRVYRGALLDSGIVAFRGVPYALPPVGDRRWALPEPLPDMRRRTEVDAREFAPACMQGSSGVDWYHGLMDSVGADPALFPAPTYAEDCLYLNIWTGLDASAPKPVLVYIHGGSNTGGWSYEPNYRGAALAEKVVVVSVAYRLGVFGFLTHPSSPNRNFALHDLAVALSWIRDNVAAFGGDPDRITLMGESAGAANASHLMVSPLSAGTARGLIHQSAGWQFDGVADLSAAMALGTKLEAVLVHDGGGLASMREASADSVLAAAGAVYRDFYFSPVLDPVSLPRTLGELAAEGDLPAFDLLVGSNADEALMYIEPGETVKGWLDARRVGRRDAVLAQLDAETSDQQRLNDLRSAAQFACPSMRFADAVVATGGRVFMYRFDRVRDGFEAVGAYHGAELPYVFDTHDYWLPTSAVDRSLTHQLLEYWLT
ncbi:carboxylesterase/lipase family protein, partial [Congregibacter sp.]|uniref:carboxylesterase/lipase family protein n=1 Tax=Congregibacter sp. TaxID=2744308 RepID=UPI003F6D1BD7